MTTYKSGLQYFLSFGTSGDRPVSLDIHPSLTAVRVESDTGVLVWNHDVSDWVQIAGLDIASFVSLSDVDWSGAAANDLPVWDGSQLVKISPADLLALIAAAPATSGTDILKGDGAGGFDAAVAGTDYAEATSGSIDDPLLSDGAGGFNVGTRSGNTTEFATSDGSFVEGNAVVVDAAGNLIDAGAPPGSGGGFISETHTTNYTLTAADSGKSLNNIGASGDVEFDLPADDADLEYEATVFEAFNVQFNADGTNTIAIGTDLSASGGFVRSALPFSTIRIKRHAGSGQWVASVAVGPWGIDV